MSTDLHKTFVNSIVLRIGESLDRIDTCLKLLTDDLIWERKNTQTSSVGNLILHLNGNIRQYILSGLGGEKDIRQRDKEFDIGSRIGKKELWSKHKVLVLEALKIIQSLNDQDLSKKIRVQGFDTNPTDVLVHVTEHYSYHTGQIALLTKLITAKDLEFFKGQDLNVLNDL